MGLAPASLIRSVTLLLTLVTIVLALDSTQVGNPPAGIDIRIPLDAFQCDEWLIYYNLTKTAYGQSLGVDYDNLALLLTTPDNAENTIVKINIPHGEGVIAWQVNLKWDTQFFVAPHGPIIQGDYVQVKEGGAGDACLSFATRTMNGALATYNAAVYASVQTQYYIVTTNIENQRTTSPSAGLSTQYVAAGVVVTPAAVAPATSTAQSTTSSSKTTSTSSSSAQSTQTTSTPSSPQESTSSHSRSSTSTITTMPSTSTGNQSSTSVPTTSAGSSKQNDQESDGESSSSVASSSPSSNGRSRRSVVPIIAGSITGGVLLLLAAVSGVVITSRKRNRALGSEARPFELMAESGSMSAVALSSTTPAIGTGAAVWSKGNPQEQFWPGNESVPPTDPSTADGTSTLSMDLARALAVVAAHVRSGEEVHTDPGGAPPEYSRGLSQPSSSASRIDSKRS